MNKKTTEGIVNRNLIFRVFITLSSFLAIGIIIVGSIRFSQIYAQRKIESAKKTLIPETVKKVLANPDYKIKSIDNVNKIGALYQFILILEGKNGIITHNVSYVSQDGKYFFPDGVEIAKLAKTKIGTESSTKK